MCELLQLAALGLNIVLISRSPYKLQNVAADIGKWTFGLPQSGEAHVFFLLLVTESNYKVKTKIIDVDFTRGLEIYERIGKELEGLEIGILINNVGMSYTYPEYLAQVGTHII